MKTSSQTTIDQVQVVELPEVTIFPGFLQPVKVAAQTALHALEGAHLNQTSIVLSATLDETDEKRIGCLVAVQSFEFCEDRSALVILKGISRVSFNLANGVATNVIELRDNYDQALLTERVDLRKKLLDAFYQKNSHWEQNQMTRSVFDFDLPLGRLCDLLAANHSLSKEQYQYVLSTLNVDERCEIVLDYLKNRKIKPTYAHEFSMN